MRKQPTILVVEDEIHIADLLIINLELEDYLVEHTASAKASIEMAQHNHYDLVIMDVLLPDGNGIDACKSIKEIKPQLPVLMLSALGQSTDRIRGLKAGADDYLPKPFNLEELLLRVDILIKRYADDLDQQEYTIGYATVDLGNLSITKQGSTIALTVNEAKLLKYLLQNPNKAISRQQIIEHVWEPDQVPNTRTIDNFISNIRKGIEEQPNNPQYIKTIRGMGYMYVTSE